MVDDGASTQRGAAVGASASAIDGALASPSKALLAAVTQLCRHMSAFAWHSCRCIIIFHTLVKSAAEFSSCMRMLSRCGMYADVSEPLPPTEEVLSGMDEDFHPDSGSSEGELFAVPSWPPRVLRLVSADAGCYLP